MIRVFNKRIFAIGDHFECWRDDDAPSSHLMSKSSRLYSKSRLRAPLRSERIYRQSWSHALQFESSHGGGASVRLFCAEVAGEKR